MHRSLGTAGLTCLLALPLGSPRHARAQESLTPPDCAIVDPDSAGSFQGMLARLTFPGPPNYESIAGGDRAETVPVLVLPQEACWRFENQVYQTVVMQLIPSNRPFPNTHQWMDHEILAFGHVQRAETGHHHTGIVLATDSIVPVPTPGH